jgi:hypothetical protein
MKNEIFVFTTLPVTNPSAGVSHMSVIRFLAASLYFITRDTSQMKCYTFLSNQLLPLTNYVVQVHKIILTYVMNIFCGELKKGLSTIKLKQV